MLDVCEAVPLREKAKVFLLRFEKHPDVLFLIKFHQSTAQGAEHAYSFKGASNYPAITGAKNKNTTLLQ